MGELGTVLIVFGYGAGVGVLCAVTLALIVGIYRNTRKGAEDDEEALVIPYSALAGGMSGLGGGGPQAVSVADIMRMRAAMPGGPGAPGEDKKDDDKKDKDIGGGTYL